MHVSSSRQTILGPSFRVLNTMKIRFENLIVVGKTAAVAVYGGALIRTRMRNTGGVRESNTRLEQ